LRHYKLVILFFLTIGILEAKSDSFEYNCLPCHIAPKQLDMFMVRYTMKYSSKDRIKKAMFNYLKNPQKENSVMPAGFLERFGVKEP